MTATESPAPMTPRIKARVEEGRARRAAVPLEDQAELGSSDDRPDPVGLLLAQDESRMPGLVPIRHGRMRIDPFTFYRGAAAIMAADLAATPTTDLRVQLCGDAHLSNFGLFKGADRRLVFDLNDFDETNPGPFEWDLKRLAASITIAGRANGMESDEIAAATRASVRGYRETMAENVERSPLELYYFRIEVESLLEGAEKPSIRARETIDKAVRKDSVRALDKLTEVVDGQHRIIDKPPLIQRVEDLWTDAERARALDFFRSYRSTLAPHRAAVLDRYRFVDMALKVVGVGSVGTRCLILLLQSDDGAPLFLQFKEATSSVLEPHVGASEYDQAGERVVRGQRLLQSTRDILLGWSRGTREDGSVADFYFRQLWDGKGSVEVDDMGPKQLKRYASLCGAALSLAHARTGDAAMISGYLGTSKDSDHVFQEFAERYADRNERDHGAHEQAIASGRVQAVDGV